MATRKASTTKPKPSDSKGIQHDFVGKLISIDALEPAGKQPRKFFDEEKLEQLKASVRKHGILEPLIVRPTSKGKYELVAGERRYKAAKAENLQTVPVIVRDLNDQDAYELALLENLQRDDLNPIEETEGVIELLCQRLEMNKGELSSLLNQAANAERRGQTLTDNVIRQVGAIDDVLKTIGRLTRESFRSNRLPLLSLPDDILEDLRGGKLEYTKAKVISKLEKANRRIVVKATIREGLSLREVKQRVKQLLPVRDSPTSSKNLKLNFKALVNAKSDAWADEKKRPKIQSLLSELESLLLEEGK